MLKLSSIPMHVLNLIAEEKSKLANKWKTTFCSLMKGNMGIQKHSKLFVSLEREKKKENGKFPRSGSPSRLGPLSRYNALPTELRGTCHERKANFKIICNKWTIYCKKQVGEDSEENLL